MTETIQVSHESAVRLALSQYVGYKCTVCRHKFNSIEDIKNRNLKCSGKDENGIRLACGNCFASLGENNETN